MEIERINLGSESEIKEFKVSTSELEDALIDITAILNKHGHGELYFGVKNNGDVVGMQIGEQTLRDISRKIYEKIKPQLYPNIELKNDKDNVYIKITFCGISKPYSCDGKYYMRVSDESRELSPLELTSLIFDSNYDKWEKMPSDCTIENVDIRSLKYFYNKCLQIKRMPDINFDIKVILSKLGLLCKDNEHLNNAGKMLFSNTKPILLKMAVFATSEKKTFIDMIHLEGNIFELINEAEQYVNKNIRWSAKIVGFDRIETPEIPIEALREIIVNSFAHANYLSMSKHEIDIHPDRIAIYNPGSFPDGLIPEDFRYKNISSKIRNELICNALFRCGEVESWSTGLRKTFELCKKNNVKVAYEKEYDGFWFFFERKPIQYGESTLNNETISNLENNRLSLNSLNELEKIVFAAIQENPIISRESLKDKTGRSLRQIQRAINVLKENGFIERGGATKRGYWIIK